MAHHYRSGLMSDIMSLTGVVKTSDHDAVLELSYAEKTMSPEEVSAMVLTKMSRSFFDVLRSYSWAIFFSFWASAANRSCSCRI